MFFRYLFLQGLSNEHRCIWEFTFSLFISLIYDLSVAMPLFGMVAEYGCKTVQQSSVSKVFWIEELKRYTHPPRDPLKATRAKLKRGREGRPTPRTFRSVVLYM
ncbi:hypothetical protein HanPSC8_Chr05g0188331 [Helianthus annuus]|nr:hypothetical protein HanPSC8_Chr05g0188331 [Helianthus annuus]